MPQGSSAVRPTNDLYLFYLNVYFILIVLPLGLKETDIQEKSIMKIEKPKIKKILYFLSSFRRSICQDDYDCTDT